MRQTSALYAPLDDTTSTHPADITSTGPTNVQTVPVSTKAIALIVCAITGAVRITFDGSTPDATHGIRIVAAVAPVILPISLDRTVQMCSESGNGTLAWSQLA